MKFKYDHIMTSSGNPLYIPGMTVMIKNQDGSVQLDEYVVSNHSRDGSSMFNDDFDLTRLKVYRDSYNSKTNIAVIKKEDLLNKNLKSKMVNVYKVEDLMYVEIDFIELERYFIDDVLLDNINKQLNENVFPKSSLVYDEHEEKLLKSNKLVMWIRQCIDEEFVKRVIKFLNPMVEI